MGEPEFLYSWWWNLFCLYLMVGVETQVPLMVGGETLTVLLVKIRVVGPLMVAGETWVPLMVVGESKVICELGKQGECEYMYHGSNEVYLKSGFAWQHRTLTNVTRSSWYGSNKVTTSVSHGSSLKGCVSSLTWCLRMIEESCTPLKLTCQPSQGRCVVLHGLPWQYFIVCMLLVAARRWVRMF